MHLPINVKSPNNISKWQVGFNSAFKGLTDLVGPNLPWRGPGVQLGEKFSVFYVTKSLHHHDAI
jgi:hypothetical protein